MKKSVHSIVRVRKVLVGISDWLYGKRWISEYERGVKRKRYEMRKFVRKAGGIDSP